MGLIEIPDGKLQRMAQRCGFTHSLPDPSGKQAWPQDRLKMQLGEEAVLNPLPHSMWGALVMPLNFCVWVQGCTASCPLWTLHELPCTAHQAPLFCSPIPQTLTFWNVRTEKSEEKKNHCPPHPDKKPRQGRIKTTTTTHHQVHNQVPLVIPYPFPEISLKNVKIVCGGGDSSERRYTPRHSLKAHC